MDTEIPSGAELHALLNELSHAQMQLLARESGVPFTTLWNVRSGKTTNPGIETVRKFRPHAIALCAAKLSSRDPHRAAA